MRNVGSPGAAGSDLEIDLLWQKSVDAAFDFVEARPASRALVFAVPSYARAGPAADGTVALIVQRIIGDFVITDVIPNRFASPIGHRTELHDVAANAFVERVNFDDVDARAGL